ncbi:hypothetical protein D3C73_185470 [compost metagenome]
MNELIAILIAIVGVIGLGVLIGYLKSVKVIKDDFSKDMSNAVNIAKLFLEVLPLDEKIKDKTVFIFDLVDDITEYVHYLELDDTDKEKLAYETVVEILSKYGIVPTDAQKQLMVLAINTSLNWFKDKEKASS